jgi:Tfp pilus assembly protein PilO
MTRIRNIVIVLLVLDLITLSALWFGYMTMQEKKAEEVSLLKERATEEQKGKKLTTVRRTLDLIDKDYTELQRFLYEPTDEGQIKFLSSIEQLGTTTGVSVDTKSLVLATQKQKSFQGVFALSGTWGAFYHFLRLIETFPARLIITRFDMRGSQDTNTWTGILNLELTSLLQGK